MNIVTGHLEDADPAREARAVPDVVPVHVDRLTHALLHVTQHGRVVRGA